MPPTIGGPHSRGFLTEEEKQSAPKITKELLLRILGYLKPYWFQFILVFVAIILSSVLGLLPSIITGKIVDEALIGKDLQLLLKLVFMAFGTLILSQFISVSETYINAYVSQKIVYDMKNQMYRHLQFMPHSFFTTEKQGDIITRMESDINGVSTVISGTLTNITGNIVTVATTVTALVSMNWKLALIGIVVLPFMILPTKQIGKNRWELLNKNQTQKDELNQHINETLSVSGSLLVKLFAREDKEYEEFKRINDNVTKISLKELRSGQWFRAMMGICTQLGPLLIYLLGGLLLTKSIDNITVGTITVTVALINRLYRPVESLLDIHVSFTRSLALFNRIFDYLDRNNPITDCENPKEPKLDNEDICFENVCFSYTDEKQVIDNVSFTIPGGKMYAIVGPSGSGKSTLVNLIPRLYDATKGSVYINGVNVKDIKLSYLRTQIGVVTQETYLENNTIRENLLFAKEDATQEELENACKIADIHDFIMSQSLGYDTVVGNRGLKLSGGEKQRISIARTILKQPSILILDEATSALDSITENAIQTAFETLMRERTSIVIAHRLSTIMAADCILVLENGKIVQMGKHSELITQDGLYKLLYETQFKKFESEEEKK